MRAEGKSRAAEDTEMLASERPRGTFSRQVFLGDTLDAENVKASYDGGVLSLRIPVVEKAKPRRIEISQGSQPHQQIGA